MQLLADYNIMFVHIKGQNNVLADAILGLKPLYIYKEASENAKTQVVMEICATNMHTISTSMLHTEQKWDKTCK